MNEDVPRVPPAEGYGPEIWVIRGRPALGHFAEARPIAAGSATESPHAGLPVSGGAHSEQSWILTEAELWEIAGARPPYRVEDVAGPQQHSLVIVLLIIAIILLLIVSILAISYWQAIIRAEPQKINALSTAFEPVYTAICCLFAFVILVVGVFVIGFLFTRNRGRR